MEDYDRDKNSKLKKVNRHYNNSHGKNLKNDRRKNKSCA